MASGWFAPVLAQIRGTIREKINGDADGIEWWQFIDEALVHVESAQDAIDAIGQDQFEDLLNAVTLGNESIETVVARLQISDADEVIEIIQSGTVELDFGREQRKARRDELIAMAKALGQIGCRVLMTFLLGVL